MAKQLPFGKKSRQSMKKEFDELTQSYIEVEDADGIQKIKTVNANEEDKKNVEEIIKSEKVNRLNKKRIIICFAVVVLVFMIIRIVPSAKEKDADAEKSQVSEVLAPDFGNYADRAYQETSIVSEQAYETSSIPPYEETSIYEQTQAYQSYQSEENYQSSEPYQSPQAATPQSRTRETTSAARNAPIAAGISWLTNSQVQGTQNNPLSALDGLLSSNNTGMSADQYMSSRLSSLNSATTGYGQPTGTNEPNTYEVQNMQGNKQDFYTTNKDSMITGDLLAPNTIWEGTSIPAILITGINTDMPGQIKAMTTENIYDSQTGNVLLIPQGTTLIAEYNSSVSYSQKRVQIAWNTLIRPDGFRLSLGNMTGVDEEGYSGVKGFVNDHLFEYVKAVGIIAAFTAINGEFATTLNLTNNETAQNIMSGTQGVVNDLGTKLIERALDVQPTIRIRSGKNVHIFINKTLSLPPLDTPPVTTKYQR